jgi:hypothetical protein
MAPPEKPSTLVLVASTIVPVRGILECMHAQVDVSRTDGIQDSANEEDRSTAKHIGDLGVCWLSSSSDDRSDNIDGSQEGVLTKASGCVALKSIAYASVEAVGVSDLSNRSFSKGMKMQGGTTHEEETEVKSPAMPRSEAARDESYASYAS